MSIKMKDSPPLRHAKGIVLTTAVWLSILSAPASTRDQSESIRQAPDLGRPLTEDQLTHLPQTIFPDGRGLPSGSGTAATGKTLFEQHCQRCHGPAGIGLSAPALAGAQAPLDDTYPDKTIGSYWPYAPTLLDFIARAKPIEAPGHFSADETYAISGYLLYLNGLFRPLERAMDADGLSSIEMPNRYGFVVSDN